MLEVIANGQPHSVQPGTSLPEFLLQTGQDLQRVVVEYNGQPLTRSEAREIQLQQGDRLEIVRIVAGG